MASLSVRALTGLPELRAGDDLAALIAASAEREQPLSDGAVLVIAHKAVSKAEGAVVRLGDVEAQERARELAVRFSAETGQPRDARAIQVVLDQSSEILRAERGVLICRTHHGYVCANAGVDASNSAEPDTLIVLPRDPDASARRIRARVRELTGAVLGVVVTDSFGRAWRNGQVDVAIGLAGVQPLDDWRGRSDASGLQLRATWLALADAAAAIGELARTKDSREPVVVIDGLERMLTDADGPGARELLRPLDEDMFR
ncbi:MAG TPA: coenzyme F420-0:L-glutamate ligase [Solirubrobacteraceae bacterium]|jgi:coenzyme F420-0:L-glutamate ligase/coenzyme F420-1:gamma-L-glutamate ligase|nr:coenzyme F420-0:L-glutamate ligase [Solirubrobacteraceae bacterium]